jgi:hypothetical protein
MKFYRTSKYNGSAFYSKLLSFSDDHITFLGFHLSYGHPWAYEVKHYGYPHRLVIGHKWLGHLYIGLPSHRGMVDTGEERDGIPVVDLNGRVPWHIDRPFFHRARWIPTCRYQGSENYYECGKIKHHLTSHRQVEKRKMKPKLGN